MFPPVKSSATNRSDPVYYIVVKLDTIVDFNPLKSRDAYMCR